MPPRILAGIMPCAREDVGITACAFPHALGSPPKPTCGFSLWEPEISDPGNVLSVKCQGSNASEMLSAVPERMCG